MVETVVDVVVGVVWLAVGLLVWTRGPRRRTGTLMAATGVTWLVGSLAEPLVLLHRGPLVHLLLAYPAGSLGWPERVVVAVAYVDAAVLPVGRSPTATLALAALITCAAARRWLATTGAVRRGRTAPLVATASVTSVLAAEAVGRLAGMSHGAGLLWIYEAVLIATPLALFVDLRAARWGEAAVTDLVVDLGDAAAAGKISQTLARAVGDSSLTVAYVLADRVTYVDERGRPIALPPAAAGRAVTRVEDAGRPVAAIVHDPVALRDPDLLGAVASVLRVAVANARLQAGVRARVADVEVSQRRLLDAADVQRRRLAAELDGEVMHRLDEASLALAPASGPLVDDLERRVCELREQLRSFTIGLGPAGLDEFGLASAVRTLVASVPIAVLVAVPRGRFPREVEATVWFICSEALANVIKHAHASQAEIRITHRSDRLRVEVVDDGVGGAELARGSGLRGLAARVQAGGGRLVVDSGPAGGTRLIAELPAPSPVGTDVGSRGELLMALFGSDPIPRAALSRGRARGDRLRRGGARRRRLVTRRRLGRRAQYGDRGRGGAGRGRCGRLRARARLAFRVVLAGAGLLRLAAEWNNPDGAPGAAVFIDRARAGSSLAGAARACVARRRLRASPRSGRVARGDGHVRGIGGATRSGPGHGFRSGRRGLPGLPVEPAPLGQ